MTTLTLNGEIRHLPEDMTVRELLAEMDLLGRKLAVERNGEVVPRSLHAETFLAEGDVVEIVTAVGGG